MDRPKNELKLISIQDNELEELALMASQIWNDHYTSIIGKEQIEYMLGKFYSRPALHQQIQEGQRFQFITLDERKIGFIATSQKENCECFIHKFYIRTDIQSSNIGSRTFGLLKAQTRTDKCPQVTFRLTVNRQNFKAVNFYFKNGFKIESVADFDIGHGYFMNDFIMVHKPDRQ